QAFDAEGLSSTSQISVNVQNAATPPSTPPSTPPASTPAPGAGALDVWFKAPLGSNTVSGTLTGTKCYVNGTGVTKVAFKLDSTTLNTDTSMSDGMQCVLDTTKFANGTHTLTATATGTTGTTRSDVISINIQNSGSTTPPVTPPPPPPPPASTMPSDSSNVRGVATFHSIGMYWTSPGASSSGCRMQFRKKGDSAWRDAMDMWFDGRNSECRGSIVQLQPGTQYEVQMGLPGQSFKKGLAVATWSESFPIAQTITLPASSSSTLSITTGGSASGYVLYQAATGGSTIDVANGKPNNIVISAPYVIVRGLTLKGAQQDAILITNGAHDVVIENNDISNWGRLNYTNSSGWQVGIDMDSGIRCKNASGFERGIVQRNRIHDPRYGANSWDWGHPAGPNAISMYECGGNNVIRHNEIWSSGPQHYFMDAIGGGNNDSNKGFPGADSDIYGNKVQHAWDDGIEAEGGGQNVRVWGNYVDSTATGIATTPVALGPIYVFRNVYDRSRQRALKVPDEDDRNNGFKSGSWPKYGGGRRYVFHNTLLQREDRHARFPLGAGGGLSAAGRDQPVTNTVSRNNIWIVWKHHWNSVNEGAGSGNDFDYDLYNGRVAAYRGAEKHGVEVFFQCSGIH